MDDTLTCLTPTIKLVKLYFKTASKSSTDFFFIAFVSALYFDFILKILNFYLEAYNEKKINNLPPPHVFLMGGPGLPYSFLFSMETVA